MISAHKPRVKQHKRFIKEAASEALRRKKFIRRNYPFRICSEEIKKQIQEKRKHMYDITQ